MKVRRYKNWRENGAGFGRFFVFREGEQLPPASSGKPVNRSGKGGSPAEKSTNWSEKSQAREEKQRSGVQEPRSQSEISASPAEKPKNPVLKLTEYLKARSGKKIESAAQRADLEVEEDLIASPETDAQDAVEKISYARKAIDRKQEAYFAAVRKMYFDGVKGGADDIVLAKYIEKSALAFQDLVGSYAEVVQIQENSVDPELTRKLAGELLQVEIPLIENRKVEVKGTVPVGLIDLADSAGTASRGGKPATPKTGAHKTYTKNEVVRKTSVIPGDTAAYRTMQNGAEMAVVNARANLFLLTGDRKYEKYYARDIQHRNKNLSDNAAGAIEKAEQADAKGLTKLEKVMFLQSNEEKYLQLDEYARTLGRRQLEIEKLRISDPVKAYGLANEFYRELDNLQKEISGLPAALENSPLPKGLDISVSPAGNLRGPMNAMFFRDLQKSSPKVFARFSQLLNIAHEKTATLARDIFQKDPEIRQFQNNLAGFMKSGEGLFKTFDALMEDLQKGETPSKPYMAKIHEDIERYTGSPYFKSIRKTWPLEKYRKYLENDNGLVPGGRRLIGNLSRAYDGLNEYIANIENIAGELNNIGGDYAGFSNGLRNFGRAGPWLSAFVAMLRSAGKFAILIGACVMTGQGLTAMAVGAYGAETAAIMAATAKSTFTTISAITAVSTLSGAGLEYLDGNKGAFDPGALIEGYGQGVVMSAASGVLAKPLGAVLGTHAKNLNNFFARSRFGWLRKFAERGYVSKIFNEEKNETLLRKFLGELGEESFEEGLEGVGRAIAPHDPWLGFVLSLLGTSSKTAKGVFNKGKFEIGGSGRSSATIRGEVTDSGIKLEYSDLATMKEFLKMRGLDAESLAKLETDGELTIEKDGVRLEVRKVEAEAMRTGLSVEQIQLFGETGVLEINDRPDVLKAVRKEISELRKSGERFLSYGRGGVIIKLSDTGLVIECRDGYFNNFKDARKLLSSLGVRLPDGFHRRGFKIVVDGVEIVVGKGFLDSIYNPELKTDEVSMKILAKAYPSEALFHYDLYKNKPYAAEVIRMAFHKAAVSNAASVFGNFDLLEGQPYAAEVIQTAISHLADRDAELVLKHIAIYGDYQELIIKGLAASFPETTIEYFKNSGDKAHEETAIRAAVKTDPRLVLRFVVKNIDRLIYSEEIVRLVAGTNPAIALELSGYYADKPYAADLIEAVAETHPADALRNAFGFHREPYGPKILRAAAAKDLAAALEYVGKYRFSHGVAQFAEDVIKDAVDKGPGAVLDYLVNSQYFNSAFNSPCEEELMEAVARKYPDFVLHYAGKYSHRSYAERIISIAAALDPYSALENAGEYHNDFVVVDAEGVLRAAAKFIFESGDREKCLLHKAQVMRIAAKNNPRAAFEFFDRYKNLPHAVEVLKIAVKKDPRSAFDWIDKYKDWQHASEVLMAVVENSPGIALEHAGRYKHLPCAAGVIKIAAIKSPSAAMQHAAMYRDQPYAAEIIRDAARGLFMSDNSQIGIAFFGGWMRELFSAQEFEAMCDHAVEQVMVSNPVLLWQQRSVLIFTEAQVAALHKKILKKGDARDCEVMVRNFLNGEKRMPVDEAVARQAVEVFILKGGKIREIDDFDRADKEKAASEQKFQDFIFGHIDKVIEDRKSDPVKAAEMICGLRDKDFPKKYPEEARELIGELRDKNVELMMGLYRVVYAAYSGVFEEKVFARFMAICEAEGEAKAGEYIAGLNEKAKGLVGAEIPAELRASDEYMYYVKYIFPGGNYSSHDGNLALGDRSEHLDGYKFDKDGYPVTLTGLLGYQFKDARAEGDIEGKPSSFHDQHLALLTGYQERLSGIRDFVASRGPDNAELQKVFEAKINTLFEAKAAPEFRELSGLEPREKMLILFVSEAARKGSSGRSFVPNADILDLIVEYKYAYHENLENYVQRSADTVKRGRDEATQQYFLWSELSQIYGENLKHILRHDIFEELQAGENYPKIVEIFTRLITPSEDQGLTPGQLAKFENTFNNPHITPDKRFGIIYKQIVGLVASNIKFKSVSEKTEFTAELDRICQKLKDKGDFTLADFQEIVPKLFALRNRFRFDINTKLDELFSADINTILAEIAKYEPQIEEEAKETRMGGEKHKGVKKSVKPRKIRSFFMKTKESANARMGAYLCIAGDGKMWENKDYFEMVMKNEETGKVVGLAMLLNIQAKDGKRYLWFGPNPFEGFLEQVSSQQTYDYMLKTVSEFAAANGYDGVVVPSQDSQILGGCTNRGGDFPDIIKASRLRDAKGGLKIVQFGEKHILGGSYGYEDGALVWERGKK